MIKVMLTPTTRPPSPWAARSRCPPLLLYNCLGPIRHLSKWETEDEASLSDRPAPREIGQEDVQGLVRRIKKRRWAGPKSWTRGLTRTNGRRLLRETARGDFEHARGPREEASAVAGPRGVE